jgi:hypothetical protein
MSTLHLSDTLLDGYIALFHQLPQKDQAVLLNALIESTKRNTDAPEKRDSDFPVYYLPEPENPRTLEELAGSWVDDRSAEEIIEDLRRSRTTSNTLSGCNT